jgi:hypothetical protein
MSIISGKQGQACLAGIKHRKADSYSHPEELGQALSTALKCSEA